MSTTSPTTVIASTSGRGLWPRRVGAYVVDSLVSAVLPIVGGLIAFGPLGGSSTAAIVVIWLSALGGFGVSVWNRWIRQGGTGQSLGKELLGIVLVGEATGKPVGPGLAFLRDLAHFLDGILYIGYLWPLWDAKGQTFADKVCSTLVVDAATLTEPESPDGALARAVGAVRTALTRNLRQSGIMIAFVVIVLVFSLVAKNFLSPGNLTNIVLQYSYILILAIGMVIVIIAGHIDLSVGSLVALTGAVAATVVIKDGMPWYVGVLAALVVGALVGMWQGFWVAFVGIPAFIVTLAGMLLFRGMTYMVLSSISLSPFGGTYYKIANGFQNGLFGGHGVDIFTLVVFGIAVAGYAFNAWRGRRARQRYQQIVEGIPWFIAKFAVIGAIVMWFAYQLAQSRGLPNVLILLGVLIVVYTLVTQKSVFGRHVYAIGGNLNAALLSGVKVRKVNFWIFVNIGVLSGIAGVVYSARMNAAQPGAGNMFELDAIAACFIGGAAVTGGVGKVTGAMIGGLIMAVMINGMQLMGIETAVQQIVKGMVLLFAVAFDLYNKRRAETR